jgi:hypothetical protein
VADWVTISSLATGGGTLVLAVSTFAAVRSANRAARVAEQALMVGLRPLLVTSWLSDVMQKIYYGDGRRVTLPGGFGAAESHDGIVYLAISVRNAGRGIGVVHGWRFQAGRHYSEAHPDLSEFRLQTRDLYIPPSDIGFWQGAIRDPADPDRDSAIAAMAVGEPLTIDVLYGDYEGGQRAVSRFVLNRADAPGQPWPASQSAGTGHPGTSGTSGTSGNPGEPAAIGYPVLDGHPATAGHPGTDGQDQPRWLASVTKHWNIDRPDPR